MKRRAVGFNLKDANALIGMIDERQRNPSKRMRPESQNHFLVDQCDLLQITSTTKVNITLDGKTVAVYQGKRVRLAGAGMAMHNDVLIFSRASLQTNTPYLGILQRMATYDSKLLPVYVITCCNTNTPPSGTLRKLGPCNSVPSCIEAVTGGLPDLAGTIFTLEYGAITLPTDSTLFPPVIPPGAGSVTNGWYDSVVVQGTTLEMWLYDYQNTAFCVMKGTGAVHVTLLAVHDVACEPFFAKSLAGSHVNGYYHYPTPFAHLTGTIFYNACSSVTPPGTGGITGTAKGTAAAKTIPGTITIAAVSISANGLLVVTGGFMWTAAPAGTPAFSLTCTYNGVPMILRDISGGQMIGSGALVTAHFYQWVTANTTASIIMSGTMDTGNANALAMAALELTGTTYHGVGNQTVGQGGSGTAPDTGSMNVHDANTWLQTALVTRGPSGDTAPTWAHSFTSGQRVGTTGGVAEDNITLAEASRAVGATGIYQAAASGITSRDYVCGLAYYK